jgi:hypothetical protein
VFGDFRPDIIWRCTPYKANQSAVCRLIYEPPTYGDRCGHDDPDDNVTTQLSALCLGQPTSDKVVDLGPLLCGQFRHDALSSLSRASAYTRAATAQYSIKDIITYRSERIG